MKIFSKAIVCVLIITLLTLSCTSCIDTDDARKTIEDFFDAIVQDDYASAETHLHPDHMIRLRSFFEGVEKEEQVDFQNGITIERYTSVESSHYNSEVDGSLYRTEVKTMIGEKVVYFTIEIVDNDYGYGIYSFDIDFNS